MPARPLLLLIPLALLGLVGCGGPDTIEEVRADCDERFQEIGEWNEEKAADPWADHEAGKITTKELMAQLGELLEEADKRREEVYKDCQAKYEKLGRPASNPTLSVPTVAPSSYTGNWTTWEEISQEAKRLGMEGGQVRTYMYASEQNLFRITAACRENQFAGGHDIVFNLGMRTGPQMYKTTKPFTIDIVSSTTNGTEVLSNQEKDWQAALNLDAADSGYLSVWFAPPDTSIRIVENLSQQDHRFNRNSTLDVKLNEHDYTFVIDGAENAVQPVIEACEGLP